MDRVAAHPFPRRHLHAALIRLAVLLLGLIAVADACAKDEPSSWPGTVQAARSDWNAQEPPVVGWVDTTLPDDWSARWPGFDGVVWYRLTWNQRAPLSEAGLFFDYLNMAGTISVNGVLLERDAHLVEPLSRMWNSPRYFLLAPPLLHEGENVALLRVSGFAADQPGLGPVRIGAAASMRTAFEHEYWLRQRVNVIGVAIGATLGLFFITLWLMRRTEVAYGWYGAQQLAWFVCGWNTIASSPWPFADTDRYAAVVVCALLLHCACYGMFVLRFFERRWPRREAALWLFIVLDCIWIASATHASRGATRDALVGVAMLTVLGTNLMFLWMAWRGGRTDQRILSLCAAVACMAGVHDALVIMRVIGGNTYYATITEYLSAVGVAVVLAWNFVRNLRRIEGFNRELQQNVDEARAELGTTLARQHELELVHARLGERVNLAHDLHDGLGGMLIGNIAAMEQAPDQHLPSRTVLGMLQELRDDLRLIIDTSSAQQYGEHSLADLLAPLRHRMTRLFEAHDVVARWHVEGIEQVYLGNAQSLDVLRVLQEALTNVLKHARARRVDVELRNRTDALLLEIRDDGNGMQISAAPNVGAAAGTGMRSMQARARRLGATLTVGSEASGTIVRLHRPW